MSARLLSLLFLAVLSATLWRIEIEVRWGWASLAWISEPHFAVLPISLLFGAWLYYFVPCEPQARAATRSALAMAGGIVAALAYQFAFSLLYGGMPLPFLLSAGSFAVAFVAIPVCVCALAWHFSPAFRPIYWILVPVLFYASFPACAFLLRLTNHPGGASEAHAVKSGLIFLGFIFAAGLPFLPARKAAHA